MACRKVEVHKKNEGAPKVSHSLFATSSTYVLSGGTTCQGHTVNGLLRWILWQQFDVLRPSLSFGLVAQYHKKVAFSAS